MNTNPVMLLPCPFCGGTAELDLYYDNHHYSTYCTKCGAWIDDDDAKTPEMAAKLWNRRIVTVENNIIGAENSSNVCHIKAYPRYTEDAFVNGIKEPDTWEKEIDVPAMPFLKREGYQRWCWEFDVDVENGKILNWPPTAYGHTHYKVVDEFVATYRGKMYEGYVPDCFSLDEEGFGDYMYLTIHNDGSIKNWSAEKFKKFESESMR